MTDPRRALLEAHGVDVDAWLEEQDRRWKATDKTLIRLVQPRILPPPWSIRELNMDGGAYTDGTLQVLTSLAREEDERHWIHVSVTRKDLRMPSYDDLKRVKILFIGSQRTAIQLFPKASNHINQHETCLHLWCCVDDDTFGLPDFTSGLGTI